MPCGISRFLTSKNKSFEIAFEILKKVFINFDSEKYILSSIDDRYWCHYIGTSIFRALKIISENFNAYEFSNTKKILKTLVIQDTFALKIRKITLSFQQKK